MNCVFVCACLEPGRDGVGDYCRGLAEELVALGHQAGIVALNDSFVDTEKLIESPLPMLRLPQTADWKSRIAITAKFLSATKAEWLSFQFVSYGIHPKGLARGFAQICQPLVEGRKVHVMCHELWIGAAKGSPLRHKLAGRLQKRYILEWLRAVNPRVVHTSNSAYRQLLARENIAADELPLFGNIPISNGDGSWMAQELAGAGVSKANRGEYWIFGIFGGIPPVWSATELLERVLPVADKKNKKVILAAIGRHGSGESALKDAAERFRGRAQVLPLGARPEEQISQFLAAVDFGVATVPWSLLGKSGAAAAMLDHGLPVIVTRNEVQFGFLTAPSADSRVILLDAEFESRLAQAGRCATKSRRPGVAAEFCRLLQRAAP